MSKNASFPITKTIVERGRESKHTANKGDEVNCYFCKWRFPLNERNVYLTDDFEEEIVHCPKCKMDASIVYYFEQLNERIRKPVKVKFHGGRHA